MFTEPGPLRITVISKGIIISQKKMSGRKIVFQSTLLRKAPDCSLAESIDDCPSNCFGNGDCVAGTCHCFLGFKGPDCGRGESIFIMYLSIHVSHTFVLLDIDQMMFTSTRTKQL